MHRLQLQHAARQALHRVSTLQRTFRGSSIGLSVVSCEPQPVHIPEFSSAGDPSPEAHEVMALNQALLTTVMEGDWEAYSAHCDPSITCFEIEARGAFAEGLPFHKFYYHTKPTTRRAASMASPHVRVIGKDCVILSYVRLVQIDAGPASPPTTSRCEETRIWQRFPNVGWKHVHFHRSAHGQ